jgi:hypothetical protein
MMEERFAQELDFGDGNDERPRRRRGRPRKNSY